VIDALFGSGLNRALEDVTGKLVEHINHSGADIVSIDIPSGLFTDRSSKGNMIVRANHTLSFQCYKPAFLVPENAAYTGDINILDISLHPDFLKTLASRYELVDKSIIQSIYRPRNRFAHKGNFGHALLAAGSYGKMGAAVLTVKSCLRSGVGLLTCHIPKCGYDIIQTAVPEAMAMTDFNSSFLTKIEEDITKYDAIGIGPGIGTASDTRMLVREIFDAYRSPMVLDADALNCISLQKDFLQLIPAGSILTPHPKEFERLFGKVANDFERMELTLQKARELNVIIILKGHHTMIATTDGRAFFNSTGNAGMATGGSGDVLTGILTGLLAQGYSSIETAIFGTYLHGLAGDIAAEKLSMEAMASGDLIECLGEAFKRVASFDSEI
jgi:NAD(P)H-hydrate epimerase